MPKKYSGEPRIKPRALVVRAKCWNPETDLAVSTEEVSFSNDYPILMNRYSILACYEPMGWSAMATKCGYPFFQTEGPGNIWCV